ncbi:MAG TPA: amidophosphoribosyltransferase, partial [Flavobacteriales bacterium]|nr:amidophosphoribosyltransferase [Flavobacteriales bacterium]
FRLRPDTHRVVHRAKYGGFPGQGRALGHWMTQEWPASPRGVVLVPVPLHWRRHVRRGFNPSQALAEGLATGWGCEVQPKLLRRLKHRVSLTSATRAARQSALRGAFGLREDCRTALPERVVLVDDVLTTGATFRACQQVFGAEGVEVVGGVWLAMV